MQLNPFVAPHPDPPKEKEKCNIKFQNIEKLTFPCHFFFKSTCRKSSSSYLHHQASVSDCLSR